MAYNWLSAGFAPSAITYSISLIVLLIASITDLKTREVPDWLNYGLVISGMTLNLLFSAIYSSPSFIINSIIGFLIFFGIAYIMFYAGQWGGGDSKILMGLGAMIGIDIGLFKSQFLLGFLINALLAGAVYGILWSGFLALKNKKKFMAEFKKILSEKKVARTKNLIFIGLMLLFIYFIFTKEYYMKILILSAAFLMLIAYFLSVFVKAIEKSSMYKLVEPSKLTEGEWIVNDVVVNKEYICGPKDMGIDKKQIRKLIEFYKKGKVKKILIKEGIPFVPSFFIAFVVTLFFGSLLMLLI